MILCILQKNHVFIWGHLLPSSSYICLRCWWREKKICFSESLCKCSALILSSCLISFSGCVCWNQMLSIFGFCAGLQGQLHLFLFLLRQSTSCVDKVLGRKLAPTLQGYVRNQIDGTIITGQGISPATVSLGSGCSHCKIELTIL